MCPHHVPDRQTAPNGVRFVIRLRVPSRTDPASVEDHTLQRNLHARLVACNREIRNARNVTVIMRYRYG